MAEQEMAQLKRDIEELENVRRTLAEFFCEDINAFKIEECFRVFHQFCQKFNQAVAENERRRIQEEQVLARRKQREEQLMARKRLRKLFIKNSIILFIIWLPKRDNYCWYSHYFQMFKQIILYSIFFIKNSDLIYWPTQNSIIP